MGKKLLKGYYIAPCLGEAKKLTRDGFGLKLIDKPTKLRDIKYKEKKIRLKNFSISKFFVYILLSIGAFLMGFPFLWMVTGSFMKNEQIFNFPPSWIPRPFEFSNYLKAFDILTPRIFLNTTIFTMGVTVGLIFLCLLSAFAFAKIKIPGANALFIIYIASMMVPWHVILIPQFVIVAKFGWINTYQGLIVPFFAQVSVGTFFFRQFFLAIPEDLYDASVVDGASIPRIFFQIYIPLAKPAILAFSVLTGLSVWNNFIWPLVVTNTQSMRVITIALYTLTGKHAPTPVGVILASSFLSIIPILIIYIVAQKKFIEGVATTGLKY